MRYLSPRVSGWRRDCMVSQLGMQPCIPQRLCSRLVGAKANLSKLPKRLLKGGARRQCLISYDWLTKEGWREDQKNICSFSLHAFLPPIALIHWAFSLCNPEAPSWCEGRGEETGARYRSQNKPSTSSPSSFFRKSAWLFLQVQCWLCLLLRTKERVFLSTFELKHQLKCFVGAPGESLAVNTLT